MKHGLLAYIRETDIEATMFWNTDTRLTVLSAGNTSFTSGFSTRQTNLFVSDRKIKLTQAWNLRQSVLTLTDIITVCIFWTPAVELSYPKSRVASTLYSRDSRSTFSKGHLSIGRKPTKYLWPKHITLKSRYQIIIRLIYLY